MKLILQASYGDCECYSVNYLVFEAESKLSAEVALLEVIEHNDRILAIEAKRNEEYWEAQGLLRAKLKPNKNHSAKEIATIKQINEECNQLMIEWQADMHKIEPRKNFCGCFVYNKPSDDYNSEDYKILTVDEFCAENDCGAMVTEESRK